MDDRPTPHDNEIEQCVLGCMILSDLRDQRVQPRRFYGEFNMRMCQVILGMDSRKESVDAMTVRKRMISLGLECSPQDVEKVLSSVPVIEHFEYYVGELVKVSKRRRILDAAEWLTNQAHDLCADPDETWSKVQGVTL